MHIHDVKTLSYDVCMVIQKRFCYLQDDINRHHGADPVWGGMLRAKYACSGKQISYLCGDGGRGGLHRLPGALGLLGLQPRCFHQFFNNLDLAYWFMPFSANISGAEEMTLAIPVEEQMQLVKDTFVRFPDYRNAFYIYAACGGKRDDMYNVMAELISAMIADTEDFSYCLNPVENNLYYSISNEIHQTLMSRFYFTMPSMWCSDNSAPSRQPFQPVISRMNNDKRRIQK